MPPTMHQMLLDIRPDTPPRFGNFISGGNSELLAALHRSITGQENLYLWGAACSGRTHLLQASTAQAEAQNRPAHYLDAKAVKSPLPDTPHALLAIDNIEHLNADAQIALFNTFNRSRELQQTLLLAGHSAPLALSLREDLRTRIGQCLIYQVVPLDDDARLSILQTLAQRHGLTLPTEVAAFLLRHGKRDLGNLVTVLNALDRASLEQKRPITLPLLRELLQTGLHI